MPEDHVTIETPEHIQFTYELAGLGSRFLALFLDSMIQAAGLGFLWVALAALSSVLVSLVPQLAGELIGIPIFLLILTASTPLLCIGYCIFFEMIWAGQTPGKRVAGLRAVRVGGQRIGFTESAIRNILRLVDFLPGMYSLGILFAFFSRHSQRIGDLAAGTIVVKERLWEAPSARAEEGAGLLSGVGRHDDLVRRAQSGVTALSGEQLETVRRFVVRRAELSEELRIRLARDITQSLCEKFPGLAREAQENPELFLEVVYQAYLEQSQRM